MVPTAEITVVLVPLAVVVTETTPGRVAVVVRRAGWARVTGTAESHLLFLFWASADEGKHRGGVSSRQSDSQDTELNQSAWCYASLRPYFSCVLAIPSKL